MVEATVIGEIAKQEASIAGIKTVWGFAQNPESLTTAQLPAVLHYPPGFESVLRAHHLQFTSTVKISSVLAVAPRESRGGQLKFLENAAMPFGNLWRAKFQDATVVDSVAAATGGIRVFLTRGIYGAGGEALTIGGIQYIGWEFIFEFQD